MLPSAASGSGDCIGAGAPEGGSSPVGDVARRIFTRGYSRAVGAPITGRPLCAAGPHCQSESKGAQRHLSPRTAMRQRARPANDEQ